MIGCKCVVSITQNECLIELFSFDDLARYVCAFQEYPKRVYTHELEGSRVISSSQVMSNTLLIFYVPVTKSGRYVSYKITNGKEICDIVESTKDISQYAPIVHMESKISPLLPESKNIPDQFNPIKVQDLGSLARLTYDPEFPDEQNHTLYAFPRVNSWILGFVTSLEMDQVYYNFNYVQLDSEPTTYFLQYRGNQGQDPKFSNCLDHGFSYFPIVKIKNEHTIFGFSS
mgnify:CR=1 FL=1